MRSLFLLLLVALAYLGESKEGSEHHQRAKRESLSRSKRRWVLSTIELEEEMDVEYPYLITTMYNDKTANVQHHFVISVEGEPDGLFSINKTGGEVYVHRRLDREKKESYHITFDVWDLTTGKKIDKELSFDVDLKDINDNAPRFTNTFEKSYYVKENTKIGEYLPVSMDVKDIDQPGTINSSFMVTVAKQTPAEPKIRVKKVSELLHQLVTEGCFDYDKQKQYTIVVIASDLGKPPFSSTATLTLNVIDTNSHPPQFKKRQYEAKAVEMQTPDDILRVAVEDKDTPNTDGWRAKYFFISGNEDGIYKITTDPKTNEGIVGVVKAKNFDITTLVKLQIGVENVEPLTVCKDGKLIKDLRSLPPKDSVNITVEMVDTNDPPEFKKWTAEVFQTEESEKGQVLYTPNVTDDSPNVRFELVEDPANWVTIDEKTGRITTIEKMDRESPHVDKNSTYRIVIAAIDDGSPPATSTCTVTVHLRDVNDNIPMLLNNTFVMCSNHTDKVILRAKDADAEPYSGPFIFSFADGKTVNERWKIDPTYGEEVGIVLLKKSDYGKYYVPIRIQDKQSQAKEERLNIEVCECDKPGVCIKILSVGLGDTVILIICAGLLPFLLLLLLCKCSLQKYTPTIDNEEYIQSMRKYNDEGPGTDCTTKNITSMMEIMTDGAKQVKSNMNLTECQEFVHLKRSNKEDYMKTANRYTLESPMRLGSQQLRVHSQWSSLHSQRSSLNSQLLSNNYKGMTGNGRNSFKLSMKTWTDHDKILKHLSVVNDKQTMSDNTPDDHVKIYQYEGNGKSCTSLDTLSCYDQQEDLSFLNDLGPEFKTLEKIIMAKSGI